MKFYRWLLNLYPARFREEYAGPLQQQFTDEYREAQTFGARCKLWLGALRDLAWSIPVELAHELRQDFSHSLRVHARRPFVMLFTIGILALAIGGATGVFSVVNAVLIKSLPFRDPQQLVAMTFTRGFESPAEFHKWRSNSAYLDDAVSFGTMEANVSGAASPVRVTVAQTSFNFFSALGSEPVIGRAFAPSEDIPGNDSVTVISHSLWQQLYGGDPRALGSKLLLNGVPMTVIGVAQPGLDYPSRASLWIPTIFDIQRVPITGVFFLQTFGRLKSGLNTTLARQMFEADVERTQPGAMRQNFENRPRMTPLQIQLAQNIRQASLTLLAAIGFVLLIACANVANLLLTRTTERRGELVIRAALGASPARLMQQLLSESVLLSFLSAAAGLGVAYWAAKLAALAQPAGLAAQVYSILDARVLSFAIALALVTGVLFGGVPVLLVRQMQAAGDLNRKADAPRTTRMRAMLIAMQVALTVILLAGSVTMARGFLQLLGADIGFQTDHLVTVSMSFAGTRPSAAKGQSRYGQEALNRLRAIPGVQSAAAIDFLPLDAPAFAGGALFAENGAETSMVVYGKVTADYFRTMGTEIIYGREFAPSDEQVAILTEATANQIAHGSAALGRKVHLRNSRESYTIVGIARPVRYMGPGKPATEQIFFPSDSDFPNFATFVVRVRGDARDFLAACRGAVQSVDPEIPVYGVKTYRQRLDETLAVPRFRTTVFIFFGGFALLLAVAGIYGVSAYSITQRRQEIGVRIAIGASAQGVRAMILRQALWPIATGMLIGLGGAAWQGRLLEHLLPVMPPVDMTACATSAALLATVAIVSIWTATSRVLELNPIEVLKSE